MTKPLPPDPEECNASRADKALEAVLLFSQLAGITGETSHTKVQDLLCNLMHLADRTEGLDFESALVWARMHYGDETCDDSDPEGQTIMEGDEGDGGFMFFAPGVAEAIAEAGKRCETTAPDGEGEPSPFDDDSGEPSPYSDDLDDPSPTAPPDALAEVLAALDRLLTVTLDDSLLSEDEIDARCQALAVFEKYGPKPSTPTLS